MWLISHVQGSNLIKLKGVIEEKTNIIRINIKRIYKVVNYHNFFIQFSYFLSIFDTLFIRFFIFHLFYDFLFR